MEMKKDVEAAASTTESLPRHLTLPGFLVEEEIGLGDLIKRATASLGIRACDGCNRRAAALNRRIVLTPGRRD